VLTPPTASARLAAVDHLAPSPSALTRSVAAATIVAAVLRVFHLGYQSLWVDEVFTWRSAGQGGALTVRDLLENVHGPLYALVLSVWVLLMGESEWVLRAPSALAGVLCVPAMAWLAHRWLGRNSVIPAAWLVAASPFLVWYSQETRNYSWLVLWAILSVASLLELQRRSTAGNFGRAFGALLLGLFTNFSFAFLGPLQLRLWLGVDRTARRRRIIVLGVMALALAIVLLPWLKNRHHLGDWSRLLPGHVPAASEIALRGETTFHAAAVPFTLHAFAVGYTLGPSLRELKQHPGAGTLRRHAGELAVTGAVFGVLGVLGLVALARRRRLVDALLWSVAPVLLVSYFASHNVKVFHPRYVAVALPCVLLAFAAALTDMRPLFRRGFGIAIAALWSVSLYHHYFVPEYAREDYRGAVAAIRATVVPGEQVLAVGCPDPVAFYGRGLWVESWWLGFAATPAKMREKFEATVSRAPGTWVVLSRGEDLDPGDRFASWLSLRYPHAARSTFTGVRVWHITKSDGGESPGAERTPASHP
jgi:mannosyltransferase